MDASPPQIYLGYSKIGSVLSVVLLSSIEIAAREFDVIARRHYQYCMSSFVEVFRKRYCICFGWIKCMRCWTIDTRPITITDNNSNHDEKEKKATATFCSHNAQMKVDGSEIAEKKNELISPEKQSGLNKRAKLETREQQQHRQHLNTVMHTAYRISDSFSARINPLLSCSRSARWCAWPIIYFHMWKIIATLAQNQMHCVRFGKSFLFFTGFSIKTYTWNTMRNKKSGGTLDFFPPFICTEAVQF